MTQPLDRLAKLLSLFHYNPLTGTITYIRNSGSAKIGDPAGHVKYATRHITIYLERRIEYRAIEVAWMLYHKQDFSPLHVSPINGDINDTRLCNLQLTEDRYFPTPHKGRKPRKPGWLRKEIRYSQITGLWTAKFKIPGTKKHIKVGSFVSKEEAVQARRAFASKYQSEDSDD